MLKSIGGLNYMDVELQEKIQRYNRQWRKMSYKLWDARVKVSARFNRPRPLVDTVFIDRILKETREGKLNYER